MMTNPEVMRSMLTPENMSAAMSMMGNSGMGGMGGMPGMGGMQGL